MENVRNHGDIKIITRNARKNCLVSESNYHKTKSFSDNVLAIVTKKTDTHETTILFRCINIEKK